MTLEEDLALIRLKDKLIAEASQKEAPSSLAFRFRLLQNIRVMEKESEKDREMRRLGRQGRVDMLERPQDKDEYWQELHKATEPDNFWRRPEATYNVLEHRTRPPPPSQASLRY